MSGEGELRLENHRIVFEHIARNPGTHMRAIARDTGINLSTLRYHLDYLEQNRLIAARQEGNLKVYFSEGRVSQKEKRIAPFLRQKRFRDVILDVMSHGGTCHSDIARRLGLRPSTLSKYLRVLRERGIIDAVDEGGAKGYIVVDERRVVELLITYRGSFWDRFVDNALEIYFER